MLFYFNLIFHESVYEMKIKISPAELITGDSFFVFEEVELMARDSFRREKSFWNLGNPSGGSRKTI